MHIHYLFITLWISIWFLSIIKLCCSTSNIPHPIPSNILIPAWEMCWHQPCKKWCPLSGHHLDPGPQLDFLTGLQHTCPPRFSSVFRARYFKREPRLHFHKVFQVCQLHLRPSCIKGEEPRSEGARIIICFIQKTTAPGNGLHILMGALVISHQLIFH